MARPAGWERGWGGQFPGEAVVRDLPTFAEWVKRLGEAVYAASLP